MSGAFREDQDRLSCLERIEDGAKRIGVPTGIRSGGLASPMKRNDADCAEERPDQRVVEERSLGRQADLTRHGVTYRKRVHERIRVIRDEDDRRVRRQLLDPENLDLAIVPAQGDATDCAQRSVKDHGRAGSLMWRAESLLECPAPS